MARVLSRSADLVRRLGAAQPGGTLGRRHQHTRRRAARPLESKASAAPSTSAEKGGGAVANRLEEAIDGAMVRLAEPDWAPFRPGTSYYAPPRPAGLALGLLALVGRAGGMGALQRLPRALSSDEALAIASGSRGYPCSTYFIDGRLPGEMEGTGQDAEQEADPDEMEGTGHDAEQEADPSEEK